MANNKDISKALDEAEQKVDEINARKRLIQERIKKHSKPVPEVDKQKKLKEMDAQDKEQQIHEYKNKALIGAMIFLLALTITYSLSTEERTSMIEYMIIILCCAGIVAGKKL